MDEMLNRLAKEIHQKGMASRIRSLVADIVRRDDFVKANQPNLHPLGFVHTKLGVTEKDIELRLHIWPDDERPFQKPRLPIHDHVWHLDSHILTGGIENEIYQVEETDQEPTHRIYQVSYDGEKEQSLLAPTEKAVRANLCREVTYEAKDHYSIDLSTYHASRVPESEFTATIVATSNSEKKPPKVLGPLNGDSEYTYNRQQCEPKVANRYINKLYEKIR